MKTFLYFSQEVKKYCGSNTLKTPEGKIIEYTAFSTEKDCKWEDKMAVMEMTSEEFYKCSFIFFGIRAPRPY